MSAPAIDYFFYFGPKPKAIFEQHKGRANYQPPPHKLQNTWLGLRDEVLDSVRQAMSGLTAPAEIIGPAGEDAEFTRRATQFRSLSSVSIPGAPTSGFRKQLASFFDIYAIEIRDHGYPLWHALPFQFPADPESAHHADEFMLGDEMLVAPIYAPGNKRQVYFPPGIWTSLETNREYQGRTTADIETAALPVFAHNGAIVPLDSAGGIALHYFPSLGGEFFFAESGGQYSQVHAAPAADVMRLEIEAKADRSYQWVIHHVERPASVTYEDRTYQWSYDAANRNLQIRVDTKAGDDAIVHISW